MNDYQPNPVRPKDPILFYLRLMTVTSSLSVILLVVLIAGGAAGQKRLNAKMERMATVAENFDDRAEQVAEKVAPLGDKLLDKGMTAVEQIDPEGIASEIEDVAQVMKDKLIERIKEGKKGRLTRRQEEWLAREQEKDKSETTETAAAEEQASGD